jgi:hypothetical protein
MIVMPANNTGVKVGYLAGRFAGKIGQLYSPAGQRGPEEFMPYALDNGAFAHRRGWRQEPWLKLMDWAAASGIAPLWALVPDSVGSKAKTLQRWRRFAPIAQKFGWPLAFAVQDGMMPGDVPAAAAVIFVGGSTEWKWETAATWCQRFPRVHIGRVNSPARLWQCHEAGAESVDGTGWTRGDPRQFHGLVEYLKQSHAHPQR